MKFNSILRLSQSAALVVRALAVAVIASVLVACGGGGVTSTAPSPEAVFIKSPRALPAEYLARKAVAYSPFRSNNRDAETVTEERVKEDLDLLIQGNFRLIRLFDSSDKVAKLVLDVIHKNTLDIKVQLGAYVIPTKYKSGQGWVLENNPYKVQANEALNQAELGRTIALANDAKYRTIIVALSVGNETLVEWTTVPQDASKLAEYIAKVRNAVTHLPITTDDNFLAFSNPAPKPVLDVIDFAAIHIYPNIDTEHPEGPLYWDWQQTGVPEGPARARAMMDASIVELKRQYAMVRVALDSMGLHAMPIAITETGWKAFDSDPGKQVQRAHPVNQKMFYERLETFRAEGRVGAGPANVFYFEAFDEPWKGGDDAWGLFDVNRKARYAIQNLYPSNIWANAALTDADALYFTPPVVNATVTTARFTVYDDSIAAGYGLFAYENGATAFPDPNVTNASPPQGVNSIRITPTPLSWGWGVLVAPTPDGTKNLSQFASLKLQMKTDYPGKISIGISSLAADGYSQTSFLLIDNGAYGCVRSSSTWCQITIPMQAFKDKNPKIDLRLVLQPFIITDLYANTGKAPGADIRNLINIDDIHWAR
jgi:exo-beta-1,3-glucanase (GH17 family)